MYQQPQLNDKANKKKIINFLGFYIHGNKLMKLMKK